MKRKGCEEEYRRGELFLASLVLVLLAFMKDKMVFKRIFLKLTRHKQLKELTVLGCTHSSTSGNCMTLHTPFCLSFSKGKITALILTSWNASLPQHLLMKNTIARAEHNYQFLSSLWKVVRWISWLSNEKPVFLLKVLRGNCYLKHSGRDLQENSAPQSPNFWPVFRHSETTAFPSQLLPGQIPAFAQRFFQNFPQLCFTAGKGDSASWESLMSTMELISASEPEHFHMEKRQHMPKSSTLAAEKKPDHMTNEHGDICPPPVPVLILQANSDHRKL